MIKPKSYYYAFTMRKNSGVKTVKAALREFDVYERYMENLKVLNKTEIKHIRYHYENKYMGNGRWNLHVHAMIKTYKFNIAPPLRRTYRKGYQIDLEQCRSRIAWQAYITKDTDRGSKEFILDEIHTNIYVPESSMDIPLDYLKFKAKTAEAGDGFDEPDEPSSEEGAPNGEGALCAAQGAESKPITGGSPNRLQVIFD